MRIKRHTCEQRPLLTVAALSWNHTTIASCSVLVASPHAAAVCALLGRYEGFPSNRYRGVAIRLCRDLLAAAKATTTSLRQTMSQLHQGRAPPKHVLRGIGLLLTKRAPARLSCRCCSRHLLFASLTFTDAARLLKKLERST